MTKERDKKLARDQQLLEAARLGQFNQLETILRQFQQLKTKKRSNPLASLRKCTGPSNIRDPVTGFTCLHHAALNGHSQCVQLILNHGARLNAVDYKGSSALHLAAWSGRLQVIKVLLSHSAPSCSSTTATTTTPTTAPGSHRSSSKSSSAISQAEDQAQSIIKSSSSTQSKQQQRNLDEDKHEELDLDLRNNDGQTALLLAAQFGHTEVVAELVRHSADVQLRNNHMESPLDLACLNGHLLTVRLLLNSSPQLVQGLRRTHSTVSSISLAHNMRDLRTGSNESNANQRQSKSGWSSLLRGGGISTGDSSKLAGEKDGERPRRASLAPTRTQDGRKHIELGWTQQSSLDLASNVTNERLLAHSPLHYAVRRCHVHVVSSLLDHYEANLFQLTSLGGVMHEIVLNNCDSMTAVSKTAQGGGGGDATSYTNGDMMRLFLAHLSRISAGNIEETRARWNQLLSSRNGQQMNVFDLINELNNRPAQDIKRVIFELSEQIEHSFKIQQQQQLFQAQSYGTNGEQPMGQACQEQLFSNARQINSFLTMKRPQLRKHQAQAKPANSHTVFEQARDFNKENSRQHVFDGTQTIDRRMTNARNRNLEYVWRQDHPVPLGPQEQLTRSVSNLINVNHQRDQPEMMPTPAQLYGSVDIDWCTLVGRNDGGQEAKMSQEQLRNVQEIQRKVENLQRWQQQAAPMASGLQARKKRSKSRDLGSLLQEVNQNQQLSENELIPTAMDSNERLYDNQMIASVPKGASQQQLTNHLVRSQTDCSHLLGRLFGGDGGGTGDLQLADRRFQPADLSRYQQFHQLQHQPRSSDNSSSLLATSHQDQKRLVPTTIAQQHSATLDRRAINRHYHVYDHEFYPPRLVSNQTMPIQPKGHHGLAPGKISSVASDRQRQAAIAIVPPLVRNETSSLYGDHPSASNGTNNSRLSLNADQQLVNRLDYHQPHQSAATMSERQHEQINRFVKVNSRKSMPPPGAHQAQQQQQQQQRLLGDVGYDQQQQQSLHNSQSFESHFKSELQQQQQQQGLLFESTRQALLRDFDKMIGHELLRQDDPDSTNASLMTHSASSSSQSSSILTGVSLDMDTQGEHLIVSGTRVTMPQQTGPPIMRAPNSGSTGSHSKRRLSQHGEASHASHEHDMMFQKRSNPDDKMNADRHSLLSHSSSSTASSSTTTNSAAATAAAAASGHRKPPQKPPRPSLKSQQIYKSMQSETAVTQPDTGGAPKKRNSIIYDQPSLCPSSNARAGSRASTNSVPSPSAMGVAPPPPPVPPLPTPKMGQSQGSITQPPSERPPPPPIQQALASPMLTAPLNVITSEFKRSNYGSHATKSSASSSNSPSSTSSASSSFRQTGPNMATSAGQTGVVPPAGGRLAGHSADGDSGFCTSNSPASHDSESGSGSGCVDLKAASFNTKQSGSKSNSCTNSIIMGPPSPRTAQMSIEEALVPLDESSTTQEMANQTETMLNSETNDYLYDRLKVCQNGSDDDNSLELDSQVELVFGWLGVSKEDSNKCDTGPAHGDGETNYENCIDLQRELGTGGGESYESSRRVASPSDESSPETDPSVHSETSRSKTMDTSASISNETNATASPPLPSKDAPPSRRDDDDKAKGEDHLASSSSNESSPRLCKEITLKVVVDESNKQNNGDEVFYIDPIELKKISNSTKCNKSEAQTLTDEELCASVDKDSGYIRFTLRKRRGLTNSIDQMQPSGVVPERDPNRKTDDEQAAIAQGSSVKRTKINDEPDRPPQVDRSEECQPKEVTKEPITEGKQVEESVVIDQEALNRRKPSADSLQADVSQASSSSTSSDMSIKSIVSLKGQQVAMSCKEEDQTAAKLGSVELEAISKPTETISSKDSAPDHKTDDVRTKPNNVEVQKRPQCSLVSEAARRVEAAAAAAAAAASSASTRQPVAAVRKTLARRDINATDPPKEKTDVKPVTVPPPRRSICWPPTKQGDTDGSVEDRSVAEASVPVIGRVTANRLSFQKLIEENNKSNSFVPTANRPKPPPPVKPASLIAAAQRLGSQIN